MSLEDPPDFAVRDDDIDALVNWSVIRLGNHLTHEAHDVFGKFGLSPSEFGVLAYLTTGHPFTQSALAREVLVRPQSMGELVNRLVERGLVERDGPGGRGRPTPLRVTSVGASLLASVWPEVIRVNRPAHLGLTKREKAQLTRLLQKMHSARAT